MDIFSLTVGFLVGSFTGAAGTYLGNKYTDIRRSKETISFEDQQWQDLLNRFPNIIQEMIDDVKNPDFIGARKFFIKGSNTTVNRTERCFEYHTDVHPELNAAILYLEDIGYIQDITPGNCPKYRFYEYFYERLKNA
jgi:hypothetical protein